MSEHFSLWQEHCLQKGMAEAQNICQEFMQKEPLFADLCAIQQGAPFHGEGTHVQDHLVRALAFLHACQEQELSILTVDEWRAARHVRGFFLRLQETLKKEKKFLTAYILAHDVGKKDAAKQENERWYYPEHAQKGAGAEYALFRESCLSFAQCNRAEAKLLRELIRVHRDIIEEMTEKKETRVLEAVKGVAERQGINVQRFLALLPAAFFLDAIVGSKYEAESGFYKAAQLVHFAECEYASFPNQQEEDIRRIHREQKDALRASLIAAGLDYEEWFVRLHTPYGKERGKVVALLDRFVKGREDDDDVRYVGNEHAKELRMRSARWRELQRRKTLFQENA